MSEEIVMPRLSDSMEEGTILAWKKSVGDEVAVGDELVEIETDKANMVYESEWAGTLVEILAPEGETVPIGAVIARVGEPGEGGQRGAGAAGAGAAPAAGANAAAVDPDPAAIDPAPPAPVGAGAAAPAAREAGAAADAARARDGAAARDGRPKASPLARRIARERGLELRGLVGTGPGGRIIKVDVERALAAQAASPGAQAPAAAPAVEASARAETAKGSTEILELSRLQRTVARRMAESKATAPHFYLETRADMDQAVRVRERIKASAADGEVVPSLNDFVVKACALALRELPRVNGAYRDGKVELYSRVNVGVAVAAEDALVVPTVFDADRKGLRAIAAEARTLAARVRAGEITPPELAGGTFTVSNLGMFGVVSFQGVINPPQAAILSVGAVEEVPVVRDGEVVPGRRMWLGLACDHRILNGAEGARFLGRVRELLEEPALLAL